MADRISEIKNALKDEKAIIGTDKTIKNLKLGKLSKVFIASNTAKEVAETIKKYAKLSNTEFIKLRIPNDELGTICKKQFSISVLSVIKGA